MLILCFARMATPQAPAKFEPPAGQVYHGAFPVSQGSTNPGDYWLDIPNFENLAGKHLAIVLWYANWNSSFQDSIGIMIDEHLKPGGRVIEVGWMPSQVPLDDIINGVRDAYLRQWFADARDKGEPIFLRFANEMNGNWLDYDGWHNGGSVSTELGWEATEKYKAAWRHVYTIAQQMHACNVAFVWAPNYASWPDPSSPQYAWNHWRNYYPGDEYVDWVGVDVYDFEGRDPRNMIHPFYDEYAARKPVMLAETAGHFEPKVGADKERYILQLFDAMETVYPRIKAFVWFNYQEPARNWRMEESPASLGAYQSRISSPRYAGAISRTMADAVLQPSAQVVCPGGSGVFTVAVAGNATAFGYRWQKDGVELADEGHYSGATTQTLTVSDADVSHVAGYRCIVTGGCTGITLSNEAALTLKASTAITQQPTSQTVKFGVRPTVTFSLAAMGYGSLRYQWQRSGVSLANAGHYAGVTTPTLTISECDGGDVGDYVCVVTGDCGATISDPARLTLTPPGDFDLDGDVDQEDFGHLQACLAGPAVPQTDPACQDARLDSDDDVDRDDSTILLGCLRGALIPADAPCSR